MRGLRLLLALLAMLWVGLGGGCGKRMIVNSVLTPALDPFVEGLFAEPDPDLARGGFHTDLHLLEGLRRTQDNPRLRELHAMALTGYALIFLELQRPEVAARIYLRSRNVGLEMLGQDPFLLKQPEFDSWLAGLKPDQLQALFWTAFPYGAWMQLNLDSQEALFRLPRVEAMIRRCLEWDESYFFAGGHLFLGALDCIRPRFLGGNPDAGLERFRRAADLNADSDFLLPLAFEARYYCPATLDEEAFDVLLEQARAREEAVLDHPQALLNAWCLELFDHLESRRGDLF